jgi:hypothetical protein
MSFFLFLLVNATLFIRPAEIVPALLGVKIYEALILSCLLVAGPEILAYLTRRSLDTQPITLCVFGLLLAVPLSHAAQLNGEKAWEDGFEFAKVVIYYVLLVSVVNTPARLRQFLFWTVGFCAVMMTVALLRYHEVIEIYVPPPPQAAAKPGEKEDPTQKNADTFAKEYVWDANKGELVEIRRLQGTGVFRDPNDLCLAVVIAVCCALYGLTDPRLGAARLVFVPALLLFGVVLATTYSRGGFLGLCCALMTLFYGRYGWRKSAALGALALPALFVLFAGRMTNIEAGSGTGQERIQLWSDWLDAFRSSPLLGVGPSNNAAVQITHVAHNSFLQGFADLGLFGGSLFLGAFFFGFLLLRRAGQAPVVSPEMARMRPYLLALVVGSGVCMLTLSLPYVIPTYLVLGLATAYAVVAPAPRAAPLLRCDLQLVQRLALVSVAWLAAVYLFVRVLRV